MLEPSKKQRKKIQKLYGVKYQDLWIIVSMIMRRRLHFDEKCDVFVLKHPAFDGVPACDSIIPVDVVNRMIKHELIVKYPNFVDFSLTEKGYNIGKEKIYDVNGSLVAIKPEETLIDSSLYCG